MHAADVVESLPTVLPSDDVLAALQVLARHGLPGLVVADDGGEIVGCISSIDLLRAVLPQYFVDDPSLTRVIDEAHADLVAATLFGTRVEDLLNRGHDRAPRVGPQASAVELAELMVREESPFALVEREDGGILGIVTANGLLGRLAAVAGGRS